jgi:transcriptional regulator with XRE-family HTH domain
MNILGIGMLVKKARVTSGLSQKAVAFASKVPRVTIVNLENGNTGDIGILNLSQIGDVIGLDFFWDSKKKDYVNLALGNINISYIKSMTPSDLERFMLSGKTKPGFEGSVMHLIDETPTSIVAGAVKQIANSNNAKAKKIWSNLASVAKDIQSPNEFWTIIEK